MKKEIDPSLEEFIAEVAINALLAHPLSDEKQLQDFENFAMAGNFDFSDAVMFLKELGMWNDGKLKPEKKYFDIGLFEELLVHGHVNGHEVFRFTNFVTERGAYFLTSILSQFGCDTAYEPHC